MTRSSLSRRTAWTLVWILTLTAVTGIGIAVWPTLPSALPRPEAAVPPNVVVIVVDTLRADHLGFFGYPRSTSPNLDRLAEESLSFTHAVAHAPWTSPSIGSLLTSRYPGSLGFAGSKEPARATDEALFLAEILSGEGYSTAAIVSHTYAGSRVGFDQGYDTFNEDDALGPDHVSSPSVTTKAIAHLDAKPKSPFFLFLHYFDPHFSYLLQEPYDFDPDYTGDFESGAPYGALLERARGETLSDRDLEHVRALYDSEIRFTDAHIGRFLEHLEVLGLYDDTLIVFTADHGEAFLDRNDRWIGHGKTLFQELLHVPLLIKLPGAQPAGQVIETPIGLVDVLPSMLQVLGLPLPRDHRFAGRAVPLTDIAALSDLLARPIFSETMARGRWLQSVIDGRFKLIVDRKKDRRRLFDLEADPGETIDLLEREPETAARLLRELSTWDAQIAADRDSAEPARFSREEEERLKALGYLE